MFCQLMQRWTLQGKQGSSQGDHQIEVNYLGKLSPYLACLPCYLKPMCALRKTLLPLLFLDKAEGLSLELHSTSVKTWGPLTKIFSVSCVLICLSNRVCWLKSDRPEHFSLRYLFAGSEMTYGSRFASVCSFKAFPPVFQWFRTREGCWSSLTGRWEKCLLS